MKRKTIAALFKRNKWLTIYTAPNGEQWISNGAAMYSMRGMPHMTPEVILRIFDIPPDKHQSWLCHEKEMPISIDCRDNVSVESEIEPLKINIEWLGKKYWFFPDEWRLHSFDEDYIKPLLDEPDYLTYHKRHTTGGGFVLACKVGFELRAILLPSMLNNDKGYMGEMKRIIGLYSATENEANFVNAADELFKDNEEHLPEVDPETGEVLEGQMELE